MEHKIIGEARQVAFDCLHEYLGLDAVKRSRVGIQHDAMVRYEVDAVIQRLDGQVTVRVFALPREDYRKTS